MLDAAPPPPARTTQGGCASTLAFELSDGPHRLVVSCGGARHAGARLPEQLANALRATAAHSTLIVGDVNSTAVQLDGSLGRGVVEVAVDRQELEGGSRIETSHDGYVRRFGLLHQRQVTLSADGLQLEGEDRLIPTGRNRRAEPLPFTVRFHLAPGVEVTSTADGRGALLRIKGGAVWQFRCRGGQLAIDDSLWINEEARPLASQQLVVTGETPPEGITISWHLRRAS